MTSQRKTRPRTDDTSLPRVSAAGLGRDGTRSRIKAKPGPRARVTSYPLLRERFPRLALHATLTRDRELLRQLEHDERSIRRAVATPGSDGSERLIKELEQRERQLEAQARDTTADIVYALADLNHGMGRGTLLDLLADPSPQRRAKMYYVLDSISLRPRPELRLHRYEIIANLLAELELDDSDVDVVRYVLYPHKSISLALIAKRHGVSRQAIEQRLLRNVKRMTHLYERAEPVKHLVHSLLSRQFGHLRAPSPIGDTEEEGSERWFDLRDPLIQFVAYGSEGEFPQPIDIIAFGVWLAMRHIPDSTGLTEEAFTNPTLGNYPYWKVGQDSDRPYGLDVDQYTREEYCQPVDVKDGHDGQ